MSGHEHTADLRYHLGSAVFNWNSIRKVHLLGMKKYALPKYYHNVIINPGATSFDGANPGYSIFDINTNTSQPSNLQMTFLAIEKQGEQSWVALNFSEQLNMSDLTAASIDLLYHQLAANETLLKRYLAYKVGYDPDVPAEFQKAMGVYKEFGILTKDLQVYRYNCLMNKSVFIEELLKCY